MTAYIRVDLISDANKAAVEAAAAAVGKSVSRYAREKIMAGLHVPASPTTDTQTHTYGGLGVYNGNPGEKPDERTIQQFGHAPQIASSYYQPNETVNISYETARIRRGTSPNLTMTSKGTQHIAGIANGNAADLAWLDRYVSSLKALASVDPNVPVYATLEHEFKAKIVQGLVTGASANPATYGRALAIFYNKCKAAHSNIKTLYWCVGYDKVVEGAVGTAIKANGGRPDVYSFDPYAHHTTSTIATITQDDAAWFRSQTWYDDQPIALTEFGMMVSMGDTALAKFYTNVPAQLEAAKIAWAVFFNRSRDNDHQIAGRSDGKVFPQAVRAFSTSLASRVG